MADGGFHGYSLDLFIILTLEEEIHVFDAELQMCGDKLNGLDSSWVVFCVLF